MFMVAKQYILAQRRSRQIESGRSGCGDWENTLNQDWSGRPTGHVCHCQQINKGWLGERAVLKGLPFVPKLQVRRSSTRFLGLLPSRTGVVWGGMHLNITQRDLQSVTDLWLSQTPSRELA